MTDTTVHMTQLMLPEQAAAPEGPLDLTMMFVIHRAFRRDLCDFGAAAARTPVADRESWAALDRRWQCFAEALHHHHSVEDSTLWPVLQRGADAVGETAATELLGAMAAEHGLIDPLLESVGSGFRHQAERADEPARGDLAAQVASARQQLLEHLAHEETDALALAQRVLTSEQWERTLASFNEGLSVKQLAFLAPWALQRLPESALQRLWAGKERNLIRMNRLFVRGRFDRKERVAFRHV